MTATIEDAPAVAGLNLADPAVLAAMAAAAKAAHDQAAKLAAAAPADDDRIREVEGGTVTLCPGGILVFTADGAPEGTAEASEMDKALGPRCTGTTSAGGRCRKTALPGTERCGYHAE